MFFQDLLQAAMANLFTAAAAFKVSREPSQCHARPPSCSLLLNQYIVLPDVILWHQCGAFWNIVWRACEIKGQNYHGLCHDCQFEHNQQQNDCRIELKLRYFQKNSKLTNQKSLQIGRKFTKKETLKSSLKIPHLQY